MFWNMKLLIVVFTFVIINDYGYCANLTNCPMRNVRAIIRRAAASSGPEASLQMQVIRKIMEDIYGGTWGVLIIKDPKLVSTSVHWTIPDHRHQDGTAAFCLHVEKGWQYNVFKTGNKDTDGRVSIENVIKRLREGKQRPERLTVEEFDQRIAQAFKRRAKSAS